MEQNRDENLGSEGDVQDGFPAALYLSASPETAQGSAPGVLGKWKQTPGDLIIYSLEDLKGCDFKKFKNKLSDFSCEDICPIPRGRLENADWITTKELLINKYGEEGALDIMIKVFALIGLMGPANDLQERRAQNAKQKITHDNRSSDFRKICKESAKEMFLRIKDYNSRMGEAINLKKRFTKTLMRKGGLQNKKDKEQEIRSSGRRHVQIMGKTASNDEHSPTTIQALFDPEKDGFIPKIVVLEGPAGIGKTMTSKMIMLDWASGDLYQDKFDFVFYLSCREINTITENISLVELLSRACRIESSDDLLSVLEDPSSHGKLLFIVDGFDELRWTQEEKSEVCRDLLNKNHKEIILQRLFRKQVLKQSSLIITTRSMALKKLNTFIDDSRNVEIQGFTSDDREEYVHKFFGNKEDADKVLSIIKANEVLYTMCAVPVTCWIVCTVMKQEIKKDLGLIRCKTLTSIYLLYLEVLLNHHTKKYPPVDVDLHTCLKKLCALANQGVLDQQILFEKKDLDRHGLSLSEVESVFMNENIFHWDVRTQTCYSFIHLSVQEFLAALCYGLHDIPGKEERTSGVKEVKYLPRICTEESLTVINSKYPHLALAVQFLFGLLNEKEVKTFSESTGINISLPVKSEIKEWAMKVYDGSFPIHAILCLYETQDEDFIRLRLSQHSDLVVEGSLSYFLWGESNCSKQLSYCLKTLKSESFQNLCFQHLTVDPECQRNVSPLLHRCQTVQFEKCTFQRCYGKFHLRKSKARDEIKESSSSKDKTEPANLSWLINPKSKIKSLGLRSCDLPYFCCDDLCSLLITNRSLVKLDLSQNNLQDSGFKLLCGGLQHPHCTLQELRVWQCKVTLSCCDDLRSVITKNQSLARLEVELNADEKMSESEVKQESEVFRNLGCFLSL
ncbi:NACHT, LRR and PYD domains-containing protein 3-like [Aquarana catesbeiana]|uniref:NACHT, LRR and PYD domains-containing protein 3-like n=1 Tax=Aquarana catesbeiana TaxID=8400 RepID=UPI003CC970EE